jgi:hypothetical protein
MRLILDRADLLSILSRHFGEMLDAGRVQVRSEPFEVELFGIPLSLPNEEPEREELPGDAGQGFGVRSDPNGSPVPPPISPEEASDDPAPVLLRSRELEREFGGKEDRRTGGDDNGG